MPVSIMPKWRFGLLLATGLGAFAMATLWKGEPLPAEPERPVAAAVKSPPSEPLLPGLKANLPVAKAAPPVKTPPVASVAGQKPLAELWAAAFSSPQPTTEVLRLREARMPGSFSISSKLAVTCGAAWTRANFDPVAHLGLSDPLADAANQPHYAKRMRAKAIIDTRCGPIHQYDGLLTPLADDPDGIALKRALGQLFDFSETAQREVAQELARQGSLHLLPAPFPYWNGQNLDPRLRGEAMDLAALLATSDPGAAAEDLRLLSACVTYGQCSDDYLEFWFMARPQVTPERRRLVEGLAKEMAAAMRAGDFAKFIR